MAFYYVRKITEPLTIRCYGYCDFTGQFDSNTYEQVSVESMNELPEGWTLEQIKTLPEKLLDSCVGKTDNEIKEIFKIKNVLIDCVSSGYGSIADQVIDDTSLSAGIKSELKSLY